ncbi:MAG: ADP-ribosylation factor-like protein [Candidatus Hermodarchaeota archaeon]
MSTDISNIINIFSKFLDQQEVKISKIETIDDIKQLPIQSYKFIDKTVSEFLNEVLDVSNIEEISKVDREDIFEAVRKKHIGDQLEINKKIENLKQFYPDLEKNLKKAITISSIVINVKDREEVFGKEAQKVIIIGLDDAGKTAILSKYGGKLGITELANLKPTKGVHRQFIKTDESELDIFVWDMGGQKIYRNKYIKNPEHYFLQIDLLIYVIDVQNSERFAESFEYFEQILQILEILEENPFIVIYIHKVDPDIKNEPEILLSIELLKDNINTLLNQYGFDYEAYLTSIYSLISNEPQFSKYIKEVMKTADSLTNPTLRKVEGLGKTLEETMNAVIRLSESISKQLSDLDSRLSAIESGAFQVAQSGIPISIANPKQTEGQVNPADSRLKVLDELKQLFDKKRKLNL